MLLTNFQLSYNYPLFIGKSVVIKANKRKCTKTSLGGRKVGKMLIVNAVGDI